MQPRRRLRLATHRGHDLRAVLEPGTDGSTRISVIDRRELTPDPAFAELADPAATKLTAALRVVST